MMHFTKFLWKVALIQKMQKKCKKLCKNILITLMIIKELLKV